MSRQASAKKRAARDRQAEADLRARLERLRDTTADCWSSSCGCHWAEWQEISVIRGLLGEDPTV